jgi:hypothetical protein
MLKNFKEFILENKVEWKYYPIEPFTHYKVYTNGDIVNSKTGNKLKKVTRENLKGNQVVYLSNKGNSVSKFVHRMVAETFIDNPNKFKQVIHIDGNKENNNVENLKWVNNASKYSSKFYKKASGEKAHDSYKIHKYDLNGNFIKTYGSIGEASRKNNIPTTNISKVAKHKRNQAGGYIWIYDESVDTSYKGMSPDIVKNLRDEYSKNEISIGGLNKKYKLRSDGYAMSRIIKGITFKEEKYYSERAIDLVDNYISQGKSNEDIRKLMIDKYKYYIPIELIDSRK